MKAPWKTAVLSAVVALVAVPAALAADITLKLGHLANEDNSWHKGSMKFAEELEALTKGAVAVRVFPNESLGKEMDVINGMQLGTADMTITGESLQNWAPKAALLAVPYAYLSLEAMDKVATGPIGKEIEEQILQRAKLRVVTYFARGPRNLTSKRPITSPAELNGLKLRVPNVPLFVQTWRSLGAAPTPMAFGEVFTALQTGVIDAQENPLALIKSASFNEVQSHVNKTEHVRSWIYLTMSDRTWSKLSEDQRNAVMEAGRRARAFERDLFLADEKKLEDELKAKGMTFVEVDKAAFAAKAKDAVLASVSAEIKPTVEALFAQQ